MTENSNNNLIEVTDLKKHFPIRRGLLSRIVGHVKAVDGISFTIKPGETLGLVGESGSGKTTVGRCLLRLIEPTAGQVKFEGSDLLSLGKEAMRRRRRDMQIIFQDPFSSLNPRMTVGAIISEPLVIHKLAKGQELEDRVAKLLRRVGLDPGYMKRYPHEFSGGQRQRIGVARALALRPKFMVCDEPVSALDVSVQAQVVNLLQDLQEEYGLAYLFIAHGLNVVEHISDRVAVMYLGQIMEVATADALYEAPQHPYTQALLSAIPDTDPNREKGERVILQGDIPTPINPPTGCPFHTRCPVAIPECKTIRPQLSDDGQGHFAACHLVHPPSGVEVQPGQNLIQSGSNQNTSPSDPS